MGDQEDRQERLRAAVRAAFAPAMERRCRIKETLVREAAEDLGITLLSVEVSESDGARTCTCTPAGDIPDAAQHALDRRIDAILRNTAYLFLRDGSCPELEDAP